MGCIVRGARPRSAREPRHALRRHGHRTRGPRGDDRRLRADLRAGVGQPAGSSSRSRSRSRSAGRSRCAFLRNEEADTLQLARGLLRHRGAPAAADGRASRCSSSARRSGCCSAACRSIKAIFNLGQMMLSVVVGTRRSSCSSTTARRARSRSAPSSRAIAAALAMSAISQALVSLVISTSEGVPFWANLRDGLGLRFCSGSSAVSVGMLAALSAATYPWALVLAAVPLGHGARGVERALACTPRS